MTLSFPENHGGIFSYADGWHGDVHHMPGFLPSNDIAFANPIYAFAGYIGIGQDASPEQDRIRLDFGVSSHVFSRATHPSTAPVFFGMISRSPITSLQVTSDSANNFYQVRGVEYALEPSPVLPVPAAAWAGTAMMGGIGAARLRLRRCPDEAPDRL